MHRTRSVASIAVVVLAALPGCAGSRWPQRGWTPPSRPTPHVVRLDPAPPVPRPDLAPGASPRVAAAVSPASAWFDGKTGAPVTRDAVIPRLLEADVVAFGELHGHPVGAETEAWLLERLQHPFDPKGWEMHVRGRLVALAMEFLERDVQGPLDDYLAGRLSEPEFLKVARQGPAYAKTHRPLIEHAKGFIPVIAANAPRRLVTEYRKSDKPYAEWLASRPEAERAWLPATTTEPQDAYRERFVAQMGPERGPRLFKAQALWDDSMADSIARFRAANPGHQVLLVVGAFHVQSGLGTLTKYASRRPNDRVLSIVMIEVPPDATPSFESGDAGEGDFVLKVQARPPTRPSPPKP